MQKSAFPFFFPHVAWGNDGAGAYAAPVPGALPLDPFCDAAVCFSKHLSACRLGERWGRGMIPPAPVLRLRKLIVQTSFRMKLQVTEREPTGAMKTKKKPAEKACAFSPGLFLSFSPDALHPAGGGTPPARERQCRSQFAKFQPFICENVCACFFVSPGNYLCDTNCYFRRKGAGTMSLLGCGVKPRIVSPTPIHNY